MRRISTTGPATPISGRTGAIGRTTRCVSPRSPRAGADLAKGVVAGYAADVAHAHDWQAALAPGLSALRRRRAARHGADDPQHGVPGPLLRRCRSPSLGLPASAMNIDGVEYFGGVGFLKGGIRLADKITTVSPTYAREILTPEFGMALDGLLRSPRRRRRGHRQRHRRRDLEPGDRRRLCRRPTAPLKLEGRAANTRGAAGEVRACRGRRRRRCSASCRA